MTNICHLKVRKHINNSIEWLLQQLRRQYINILNVTWHSSCPRVSKTNHPIIIIIIIFIIIVITIIIIIIIIFNIYIAHFA